MIAVGIVLSSIGVGIGLITSGTALTTGLIGNFTKKF